MITIIIGILASIASEVVVKLNKMLTGTVLEGRASFIVAFVVAIIGSIVKFAYIDGNAITIGNYQAMAPEFAAIWGSSELFFQLVTKKLTLDVQA